uniref:Thyroglobulin type-1 domain-containing protein n=1 Tax=Oryzias melastigma TaxID=30732 RepID=A0A3B3BB47_ORYME
MLVSPAVMGLITAFVLTCRPKSQCELHRDSLQDREGVGIGSHIPQCDSDGRYRQLQCHGSTGYCWCVDSSGQERQGTRTPPGTTPTDYCDKPCKAAIFPPLFYNSHVCS